MHTRSFYNDPFGNTRIFTNAITSIYEACGSVRFGCGQTSVKPHGHRGLTSKLPRYNLGQTFKSPWSHRGQTEVQPRLNRGFC